MAPEILLDRCYDPSADLWSIGCILYECLAGSAPYSSKNLEELLHKIKTKQPIDIRGIARLSAACEDLLARLLVHDPAKRISFVDFFDHEFLDMEHEPTSEVCVDYISRKYIFLPPSSLYDRISRKLSN